MFFNFWLMVVERQNGYLFDHTAQKEIDQFALHVLAVTNKLSELRKLSSPKARRVLTVLNSRDSTIATGASVRFHLTGKKG